MQTFILFFKNKLGIDKSIFFTSLTRILQSIGGVISVLFVARYLNGVEQGFYYTFGSIVAIQVFFELGLNSIITQYTAHEASHLHWENSIKLNGDHKYLSRLSSLLHFSVKWYLCFAGFLLITLIVIGNLFFQAYGGSQNNVSWKIPWILLAVGTAINLLLAPILAFLEGLGKVKDVAKVRLSQQCVSLLIIWGGLAGGVNLYVSGISSMAFGLIAIFLLYFTDFRKILSNIWSVRLIDKVNYRKEIFPYQWKIALSWISGYFIFQLFNPVLFATDGAVIAGQMGMTLAALNGIQALSLSWMTTKVPLYSNLIAQKRFIELDSIFNTTLRQSTFINGSLLVLMFGIIFIIRHFHIMIADIDLGSRFLDYLPMLFMMIPLFINQFVSSWATYLRCHKQEPFLVNSIVGGILCATSTLLVGKEYGVYGITFGYSIITFALFIWAYWIFKTKKHEWHKN